jgi:hypothetical protein
MINFEQIMTRSVIFYDDEYESECLDFARSRNISLLPDIADINYCHRFGKRTEAFKRQKINPSQMVHISDDVFQSRLKGVFQQFKVVFVTEQQQIVGVVHFSDYNRQAVYKEVYDQLFLLEKGIKYILLNLSGESRYEWLKFRGERPREVEKRKTITTSDLHAKDVSLPILLNFIRERNLLKVKREHVFEIKELRNNIAHSEAFVKRGKGKHLHELKDFYKLIDRIEMLRIVLRQVNNRIYLMKATLDSDFKQAAMPLDEFLFYHE